MEEKALALRLEDPHALADYAFALTNAGRVDEAITRYRRAVRVLDPDHRGMQINLGAALMQTGRIEEARGEVWVSGSSRSTSDAASPLCPRR